MKIQAPFPAIKKSLRKKRDVYFRILGAKVLKLDRSLAGRFSGLTGLWPEGCGIALTGDEICMPPAAAALPTAVKTKQPGFARGNAPLSPPTAPLHGKASHWILRSLPLPYESSSLATPVGKSALRLPFISYIIMNNITVISRLRWLSPFGACGTTFPPDGGTMDAKQRATCL